MSEIHEQININTADKEQLLTLPGIGDALAERILAARPFSSLDGLKDVDGIGDTMFGQLSPLVTLSDSDDSENLDEAELPQEQSEITAIADKSNAPAEDVQEPRLLEKAQDDDSSSIPESTQTSEDDLPGEPKSSQAERTQSDADEIELDTSAQEVDQEETRTPTTALWITPELSLTASTACPCSRLPREWAGTWPASSRSWDCFASRWPASSPSWRGWRPPWRWRLFRTQVLFRRSASTPS